MKRANRSFPAAASEMASDVCSGPIAEAMSRTSGEASPQPEADADLMRHLAAGDMQALAELVRRHQQRVHRLAFRLTHDVHRADDITQEAFLRLYRFASRYRPTAALTTWLHRVVVNLCLDEAKRRKPHAIADVDPPEPSTHDAAEPAERRERREAVTTALMALPERQRAVLVLHRFEGLSHDEIQAVTGFSRGAIESLLVRAYGTLRDRLRAWRDG